PAAILAFRNYTFEIFVVNRMIFHFNGEMLLTFRPGKPLRKRPRFQDAFHLQPEIIMQSPSRVFLNHELGRAADWFGQRFFSARLRRSLRVVLRFVLREPHLPMVTAERTGKNRKNRLRHQKTTVASTLSAIVFVSSRRPFRHLG